MVEKVPGVSLETVASGQEARVLSIGGGPQLRARLAGMGILPGVKIKVTHKRGGPIMIAAGRTRLALGRSMVRKVMVTVSPLPCSAAGTKRA